MKTEERKALIKYRIEQSQGEIKDIQVLLDNQLLTIAVSRIYYAMFHVLSALALSYEFQTSKHAQLIGWFNKNFIKEGIFPVKYGEIIYAAYENRTESDYGSFIHFEPQEVLEMYENLKDFTQTIIEHLDK